MNSLKFSIEISLPSLSLESPLSDHFLAQRPQFCRVFSARGVRRNERDLFTISKVEALVFDEIRL